MPRPVDAAPHRPLVITGKWLSEPPDSHDHELVGSAVAARRGAPPGRSPGWPPPAWISWPARRCWPG